MRLLPYLTETPNPTKKYNVTFRGINYGEGTQDGEFSDTYNLSTDKYPCITQRAARVKTEGKYEGATTVHTKGGLLVIAGTRVFYNGVDVGSVTEGKKQTATVGNYIVIFPDKKYINVTDEKIEVKDMEVTYTAKGLKFTNDSITTEGEVFDFKKGDGVKISGCSESDNNKTIIIRGISADKKTLSFYENSFVEKTESEDEVTITREIPTLEFICESNYRLWGVKGNTIFSSKFSDPFNFNVFDGLSSDSYNIDVGSDGAFTGCIPYSTHICFFKENTLHKLYGTKPSNFQVNTVNVYGVQSGCERSMHIVNEQLLYKGVDGIYSYTGGIPELISPAFGTKRYTEAVASCDGTRYYVSMKGADEKWNFFVYDVLRGLWIKEDDTRAVDMTFCDGKVYFLDDQGDLYYIDQTASRKDVEWGATFCTIHETINERKVYSKFHLRMTLEAGSWVAVDIKTDNDLQWRQVYITHSYDTRAKTVSIPILPTRCDSIDIRLRGKGECTVKSFVREFSTGSDV